MAEEQQCQAGRVQEQNHAETMVLLQGGLQIAQRGQWTALTISFCVIIAIIVLIVLDKMDAASFGVAVVLGALATLVGRFLWDFSKRRARPDDSEIQAADLPEPLAQPNQQTLNR